MKLHGIVNAHNKHSLSETFIIVLLNSMDIVSGYYHKYFMKISHQGIGINYPSGQPFFTLEYKFLNPPNKIKIKITILQYPKAHILATKL